MIQEPLKHWTSKEGVIAPGSIAPADYDESNRFYETPPWDAALAQWVGRPVILLDVTGEDGLALARLPVVRSHRHGRYPALHCANWVHPHCYYGAPLLRAGREQEGWRGRLEQLAAARWSGDFLHLRLIDADGPAVRALQQVCAAE